MSRIARILFGNVAPGRKGRDFLFVVTPWLLADVVTKCLALWCLAERGIRFLGGDLRLQLSINERLYGSGQAPSDFGITQAMILGAVLVQILFAGAGFAFGRAEWTVIRKLALMGPVVIAAPLLGILLGSLFRGEPHRLVLYAARACDSLIVLLLALRLTRSRYLGLALALGISGNLGNTLNVIYYPRGVIDFIFVPRLDHYIGIFNLSDVALEISKGLVLLSPPVLIVLHQIARRSEVWKRQLEYVNPQEPPPATIPASE